MSNTKFTLDSSFSTSNGTSNLMYLLSDDQQQAVRLIVPRDLEKAFGPGDDSCYIPSKGYTDPEWYWTSSAGCVWGIGWRNGVPRIRGRGTGRMENRVHPDRDSAAEFVEFLCAKLSA